LGSEHFVASSAGLGAGNTLEEAIVHGVCEVVERDASVKFGRASEVERQRRRLDLDSVNDPLCRELLTCYAPANVTIAVWDITTQLRIPCFACCVRDDISGPTSQIGVVTAEGCHPSRTVALARALSEAAQRRIARLVGLSDDAEAASGESSLVRATEWDRFARDVAEPPVTRFLDVPSYEADTCQEDIAWLRQRFNQCDLTVAAVDLSHAKYPVHVVRAVATGLEARSARQTHAHEARTPRVAAERGLA
jgi:ribosomal protein S12 methylthiotransferase accessory factor